jgi:hypothetical protein
MARTLIAALIASALSLAFAAPAAAQGGAPAGEATIELVNEGAGTKRQLRYAPTEGDVRRVETSVLTDVTSMMGPMVIPEMYTLARVEITEVGEGQISMTLEYLEAEARARGGEMPGQVQQMDSALGQIVGSKGDVVVNDRGEVISFELAEGAQVAPQILSYLKDAMGQIATPMPEEAVGEGATWTVTTPMKQNDISLTQTSTYEITSIKGDRVDIRMTMKQEAEPQEIETQGMKLQLVSMVTEGDGSIGVDLGMMTPITAEAKMLSTVTMQMAQGGQNIEQKVDMKTSMKTVEGEGEGAGD